MEPAALLISAAASVCAAAYYARQAHRLRATLRQYAGHRIARLAPGDTEHTDGHRTSYSIIFLDLQGFTTAAEGMPPERVAWLLQVVFPPVISLIRDRAGEVDKIMGDGIVARHRSAAQALEIAVEARRIAESMRPKAQAACGLDIPDLRVGVHTGAVWLGHIGLCGGYVDYTCIGDAVNTAARVQALAAVYGYPSLCTGESYAQAGDPGGWQLLDTCRVKGREKPLKLYTKPPLGEPWNMFCTARDLYAAGDFHAAEILFTASRAPGSSMWAGRCRVLGDMPPDALDGWHGIWTHG